MKHREEQQQQQQHKTDQLARRRSLTWACENEDVDESKDTNALVALDKSSLDVKHEQLKQENTRDGRSFSLDVMQSSKEMNTIYLGDNAGREGAAEEEKIEQIIEAGEDEDKNYHLLFVLNSDASTETFVTDLHRRPCKICVCVQLKCFTYQTVFNSPKYLL